MVRDNQGHYIADLTKDSFQLFDKGKPQTIASFTVIKHGAPVKQSATPEPPTTPIATDLPQRYVAYLIDDLNIQFADLANTKKAALHHVETGLQSTDRAAIYTTSGRTTQDFTADKAKLAEALAKIQPQSMFQHVQHQCPDITYYMADLIVNKNDPDALQAATLETLACMMMDTQTQTQTAQQLAQNAARVELTSDEQGTRVTLDVVKNVIRHLGAKPGQRLLVLASPGFLTQTPEAFTEKTEILDLAARMNVIVSSVNARGLFTTGMDASQQGAYNVRNQQLISRYQEQSAIAEEDILAELADGTGGVFFHNSNDLNAGFASVATVPDVSYVLGFSPPSLKSDGSFHRLKIDVVDRKGTSIQARRGYYAAKHGRDPDENAKNDIESAVFSREEMNDIPVGLQTQFFKSSANSAKLTVLARIDLRRLHFKKEDLRNCDELKVVSALFDRDGNYITGISKTVTMKLRDVSLAHLSSGITVKTVLDVNPGTYLVRLVVRDSEGQAMAAQNGAVEIP